MGSFPARGKTGAVSSWEEDGERGRRGRKIPDLCGWKGEWRGAAGEWAVAGRRLWPRRGGRRETAEMEAERRRSGRGGDGKRSKLMMYMGRLVSWARFLGLFRKIAHGLIGLTAF